MKSKINTNLISNLKRKKLEKQFSKEKEIDLAEFGGPIFGNRLIS